MDIQEEILNTAAELFLTLGVKSVTMDDIANKMGKSKKTLYANYSTKTKLIEATTLYVLQKITEGIDEIRKEGHDPIKELFKIKQFTIGYLKDEMSSPQYQLEKYYPKIYKDLHINRMDLIHLSVRENLEEGIRTGMYRPEIPVEFITKIYFVGVTGIKDRDLFPEENSGIKSLYNKFLEYHLRAIVTPKGLKRLKEHITIDE